MNTKVLSFGPNVSKTACHCLVELLASLQGDSVAWKADGWAAGSRLALMEVAVVGAGVKGGMWGGEW